MIFKMTRAPGSGRAWHMKPKRLPCGCEVAGHAQLIGVDGLPLNGSVIAGFNTKTGWLWVRRWYVEPGLTKEVDGKLATTKEGMELVHVTAPFELRCVTHGRIDG